MKSITAAQFVEQVKDMDGHVFSGITTVKVEDTLKCNRQTGEPFNGCVTSETIYNPMLGLTYQQTVNNRLQKEGKTADFQAGHLPWGQWHGNGRTIIAHNGQYYLRLTLVGKNGTKKRYFLNGREVNRDEIENVLPVKKQSKNEHQGLDEGNEVIVVNVKVGTINRIAVNGEEMTIIP